MCPARPRPGVCAYKKHEAAGVHGSHASPPRASVVIGVTTVPMLCSVLPLQRSLSLLVYLLFVYFIQLSFFQLLFHL